MDFLLFLALYQKFFNQNIAEIPQKHEMILISQCNNQLINFYQIILGLRNYFKILCEWLKI